MSEKPDPYIFKREDFDDLADSVSTIRSGLKDQKKISRINARIDQLLGQNMQTISDEKLAANNAEMKMLWAKLEGCDDSIPKKSSSGGFFYFLYRLFGAFVTLLIFAIILFIAYKFIF